MGILFWSSPDPSKVKRAIDIARYSNYIIELEYHFLFNRHVEFKKTCVFIFQTLLLNLMDFYVTGLF